MGISFWATPKSGVQRKLGPMSIWRHLRKKHLQGGPINEYMGEFVFESTSCCAVVQGLQREATTCCAFRNTTNPCHVVRPGATPFLSWIFEFKEGLAFVSVSPLNLPDKWARMHTPRIVSGRVSSVVLEMCCAHL